MGCTGCLRAPFGAWVGFMVGIIAIIVGTYACYRGLGDEFVFADGGWGATENWTFVALTVTLIGGLIGGFVAGRLGGRGGMALLLLISTILGGLVASGAIEGSALQRPLLRISTLTLSESARWIDYPSWRAWSTLAAAFVGMAVGGSSGVSVSRSGKNADDKRS